MVTDEERDYMYGEYAKDPRMRHQPRHPPPAGPADGQRPAPDRAAAQPAVLAARARPVLYYGDEIGMGDNIYLGDRNGVRTPMQWTGDRNAGFSRADPPQLYLPVIIDPVYDYQARQRRGPGAQPDLAAELDAAPDRRCASSTRSSAAATIEFLHPDNRQGPGLHPPATRARRSWSSTTCRASPSRCELDLRALRRPGARSRCSARRRSRRSASSRTSSTSGRTASTGSAW